MRKLSRLFLLAFVSVLSHVLPHAIAADDTKRASPNEGGQDSREWGKEVAGVRCSISTDRKEDVFSADQPVWVRFSTRNSGTEAVKVEHASILLVYSLTVTGPDGKPAGLTQYGRKRFLSNSGSMSRDNFSANAEESRQLLLSRYFDMSRDGKYEVSFKRPIILLPDSKKAAVESNNLTITIDDEQPADVTKEK